MGLLFYLFPHGAEDLKNLSNFLVSLASNASQICPYMCVMQKANMSGSVFIGRWRLLLVHVPAKPADPAYSASRVVDDRKGAFSFWEEREGENRRGIEDTGIGEKGESKRQKIRERNEAFVWELDNCEWPLESCQVKRIETLTFSKILILKALIIWIALLKKKILNVLDLTYS